MTQKEYVNLERAMQELHARRNSILREPLALCIALTPLILMTLLVFVPLLNVAESVAGKAITCTVMGLVFSIPVILLIRYAVIRRKIDRRLQEVQPVIIRSTLGSKHEEELVKHEGVHFVPVRRRHTPFSYFEDDPREYKAGYWHDLNVLYFPEGRFVPPDRTFIWSKEYAMTAKGLFLYARPGDEFYLLIGQRLQGKPKREILLACPVKLFRWEESEVVN